MKTTYLIALATLALGTFGCSSNTTVDSQDIQETGGSAGSVGIGDAGSGSEISGSGGDVVQPTGGTGADLGGTAGEPSLGGTSGEPSTGGTGNTGGTCVPKTCLTIAVELAGGQTDPIPEACGIVDDGCGNLIDCGGCEQGICGGGSLLTDIPFEADDGIPGLCNGGCQKNHECGDGRAHIVCSNEDITPTKTTSGQTLTNCTNYDVFRWCCDM